MKLYIMGQIKVVDIPARSDGSVNLSFLFPGRIYFRFEAL